ncbi:MAG: hypothetical protein A3E87_07570 [Gammaproteobacteria bacterium RIFCSPHIGHO2_12_FULL_35_23]|nr:MAG: hypothetical protein A3E87_07570 [Gammaproteobacteria bacterium RIFCSPHIGHO2_12_FULL_35_23]
MGINSLSQYAPILGRVLIGFFFFFFGIWNAMHWRPTLEFMYQKKIPIAMPFLFLGIAWQTITGLLLMLGIWVKLVALLLIPFDIISVLIFHAFWNFTGETRRLNMLLFVANLTATLGALLLLLN